MASLADKLIFPAPTPTYGKDSFKKHLCWIPWNDAVSPDRLEDERYAEGVPCLWLPAPRAAGVILFCHANAEDLGMSFAFVRHMRDQFKMNVMAVEYPGYGLLSHLHSCEASVKETVLTAFRFILDELKVAYEQIILFGRSMGSGPTVFLASRFPVGGLILVGAFASVREVIKHLFGGLVAAAFVERFPNIQLIGNVSCPTLFIHGEKDNMAPPSQSVALFKQCRARKLLITPPSMEHNTNLFTDASFLAVPAINFFGLPGYQQEAPPHMPNMFFEDGRKQFLLRKASKRRQQNNENTVGLAQNPWFILCGCPTTNKGPTNTSRGEMEPQPPMDCMESAAHRAELEAQAAGAMYEGLPRSRTASGSVEGSDRRPPCSANGTGKGTPSSAGRETAAAAAKVAALSEEKLTNLQGVDNSWQDFHDEEVADGQFPKPVPAAANRSEAP